MTCILRPLLAPPSPRTWRYRVGCELMTSNGSGLLLHRLSPIIAAAACEQLPDVATLAASDVEGVLGEDADGDGELVHEDGLDCDSAGVLGLVEGCGGATAITGAGLRVCRISRFRLSS